VTASGGILNEGSSEELRNLEENLLHAGRRRQGNRQGKIVHLDLPTDRVPPHSHDAEMAVLGAMMLEKEAAGKAIQILSPDAFYRETHRLIYQAMLSLADRNQPIDIITLNDELRRMGKLQDVGGSHYLSELNMRTPTAANVEHHARLVFEKALKRRLISAAMEIMDNCYSDSVDAFEEVDRAEQRIFQIAESRSSRSYQSMKRLAIETVEMLETISSRFADGGGLVGVPSGLVKLDGLTGGFQKSDLIILAARPSMGKCVAAHTLIDDPATGERLTIEECIRRRMKSILGVSDSGKVRATAISDWIDSGIKPTYRVTTRTGRSVEVTGHHPFLTVEGWKPLHDLAVGRKIAIPRVVPAFGNDISWPLQMVRLLAYFIAEGGLTDSCPEFTNTDPVIVEDFIRTIGQHFPACRVRRQGITYIVAQQKTRAIMPPNPVTTWLAGEGLWKKLSCDKRFPASVWRWDRTRLAAFLNVLFSCDGTIYSMGGYPRIEFTVASKGLALDVQHALVRFGIVAKLWQKTERSWRVEITEPESVERYQQQIGWIGEKASRFPNGDATGKARRANTGHAPVETWGLVRRVATKRRMSLSTLAYASGETATTRGYNPHTNRGIPHRRLVEYARVLENNDLHRAASSDIYWDEIVAIEYAGEQQVYDLTVPDGANFIAQDIFVHNTALAMSMARNAAIDYKKAVAFFSLEMSAQQLVMRLISAEAKVDAHRLRTGDLKNEHWQQIVSTIHRLTDAPIYIDDTPAMGIMELRARARLMRREHNIEMIVIDYLQLMHAPKAESREREISMISRGLKQLSKELDIPIIALSQLNRSVESRGDKRPMLSDLRESGCLTGDTLITLADSNTQVPLQSLIGRSGFVVWALNEETMRIERSVVSRAFSTGVKPVYRLTTRLGRTIRATANHKFRSFDGWKRLDELHIGERMALPRTIPSGSQRTMSDAELALLGHLIGDGCTLPRHVIQYTTREYDLAQNVAGLTSEIFTDQVNPRINSERQWYQVYLTSTRHHTHGTRSAVAEWLSDLGVWGLRSYEKHVPAKVFEQPAESIAHFLRHLWATDGCIRMKPGFYSPAVYYASSSERLARDVQSLLLRLGINAWLRRRSQNGKGRDQFHVSITGKADLERFIGMVGADGVYKSESLQQIAGYLEDRTANTNRDIIPSSIWKKHVLPAMKENGISTREMAAGINAAYSGTHLYKQNVSRDRAARIARAVRSEAVAHLAESDIYWDEIVSIEPDGVEEVFDLTVPGPHNFIANDLIVHNSIEQDADVVMFVHRPEYYGITVDEDGMPTEGTAEVIIGKQRNGPTGTAKMAFINQYARFENLAFQYDNAPQHLPPPASEEAPF
jgi:replicative DNA helicase